MVAVAVVALLVLGACDQPGQPDPEEMGVIAASIHQKPGRAEEILRQHDMTLDEFEERIWEIAEDPEEARRFTRAMEAEIGPDAGAEVGPAVEPGVEPAVEPGVEPDAGGPD